MAYTRKGKRAGEIAYACLACQKSYKDKNTQKVRATAKVYRSTHADQRRQNFVRWRQNNRERSNELSHGHRDHHRTRLSDPRTRNEEHARDLEPEPDDLKKINEKLRTGLVDDAVPGETAKAKKPGDGG